MNYNPVYPVFVKYNVSQDVWNLHDIYVWHFLLKSFGTKKTFRYLRYRLEHNQSMYPVVSLLCIVFLISWLVTFWFKFGRFRRELEHQSPGELLKRFILHLNPALNLWIERRARPIRPRRERQATRVITSQPGPARAGGPTSGSANGESVRAVDAERPRRLNSKRQHPALSTGRTLASGQRTDSDSNNSAT